MRGTKRYGDWERGRVHLWLGNGDASVRGRALAMGWGPALVPI